MTRFLEVTGKLGRLIPEVSKPKRKPSLNEKLIWTALALVIYLVMGFIDLYGIPAQTADPLRQLRVLIGGARGTIEELGIGPIITGGLILQLLVGSGIISYDQSAREDRELFAASNKLFSLIFAALTAALYAFGGTYGQLPMNTRIIIFSQLTFACFILILLDEMLQKGWGLGSGISLFILAGVTKDIFWKTFSPLGPMPDGLVYGSILALIQSIFSKNFTLSSLVIRKNDPYLPTIFELVFTIILLVVLVYLDKISVDVPISSSRARGFSAKYPIKLLFVSTMPIIMAAAIFTNVMLLASYLQNNPSLSSFGLKNFTLGPIYIREITLGSIIGHLNTTNNQPIDGLVYYTEPPRNILTALSDPVRSIVYIAVYVVLAVISSVTWVIVSGMDAKSIADQLVQSGVVLPGFRSSSKAIQVVISDYLDAVTVFGGAIIGLLAGIGDILGVYGGGAGLLLSVGIVYGIYEMIAREQIELLYPRLKKFIPR
ncbi:MAG: preprotein translocase subunit SecY [Thermoproteota archaeon]|jgi:preprotein translocase SecY subunit